MTQEIQRQIFIECPVCGPGRPPCDDIVDVVACALCQTTGFVPLGVTPPVDHAILSEIRRALVNSFVTEDAAHEGTRLSFTDARTGTPYLVVVVQEPRWAD